MQELDLDSGVLEATGNPDSPSSRASFEQEFCYKVLAAARAGQVSVLRNLLRNCSGSCLKSAIQFIAPIGGEKLTPLIVAAKKGHSEITRALANEFNWDLEQEGTVRVESQIVSGVTALWCAAALGHVNIVRILVNAGALVDHATATRSTPLRAACFTGNIDIAQFLISAGADVNSFNELGNTCLMVASYQGHKDVVRCLLQHKARIDCLPACGTTALHLAAERGNLEIVKALVSRNAPMVLNEHHMTPLMVAANSARVCIVEFLTSLENCQPLDKVEAYELLATSLANLEGKEDLPLSYHFMYQAMLERENRGLLKQETEPQSAYGFLCECRSAKELEEMKQDYNRLLLEALIMRERLLGSEHIDVTPHIEHRAARYVQSGDSEIGLKLYIRAAELKCKNNRYSCQDLRRILQLLTDIKRRGATIICTTLKKVMELVCFEINSLKMREDADSKEVVAADMHTMLYLLAIAAMSGYSKLQRYDLSCIVHRFCKMDARLSNGFSALHMAVHEGTYIDRIEVGDEISFPDSEVVRWLLACGHDVDSRDVLGNTPLHIVVQQCHPMMDFKTLHDIIILIARQGGHLDLANTAGYRALELCATGVAEIILQQQIQPRLKCIAARFVRRNLRFYETLLPRNLVEFVELH